MSSRCSKGWLFVFNVQYRLLRWCVFLFHLSLVYSCSRILEVLSGADNSGQVPEHWGSGFPNLTEWNDEDHNLARSWAYLNAGRHMISDCFICQTRQLYVKIFFARPALYSSFYNCSIKWRLVNLKKNKMFGFLGLGYTDSGVFGSRLRVSV